jgi:hypothetical protein
VVLASPHAGTPRDGAVLAAAKSWNEGLGFSAGLDCLGTAAVCSSRTIAVDARARASFNSLAGTRDLVALADLITAALVVVLVVVVVAVVTGTEDSTHAGLSAGFDG